MVVPRAFEGSLQLAMLLCAVGAGGGCGGASRSGAVGGGAGATGGAEATGATGGGADAEPVGAAQAGVSAVVDTTSYELELDGPPCQTRRAADCTGVVDRYSSDHATFDDAPELAACSQYVSFDGCGKLIFSFDRNGCGVSVGPGPGGWNDSGHLSLLRDCLSSAFSEARFPCLASGTLTFEESCLIR